MAHIDIAAQTITLFLVGFLVGLAITLYFEHKGGDSDS